MTSCENFCTKAECEELKSLIVQLTSVVEENTARINVLESDLDILAEEFNQLKITVEDNTARINVLESDLDILAEEFNQLKIIVEDNTTRINVLESELDILAEEFNNHLALEIPEAHNYQPFIDLNIFEIGDGNYLIKIIFDGQIGEDNLLIMADCDLTEISDKLENITTTINNIDNVTTNIDNTTTSIVTNNTTNNITEVDNTEVLNKLNDIETINNNILDEITIDISGTTVTEFQCNEQFEVNSNPFNYAGVGIRGLHELTKTINSNLLNMSTQICQIESQDIVSIVASPKVVSNVTERVLILHFVTLDNYPKRQKNSKYNPIQIPAPLDEYDWALNFENLRWFRGNQYAELELTGYKARVSGWFENEAKANLYFDAILSRTNATEKNRVIPKHSNPKTSIPVEETRPYRAFIKSVNEQGQAVCHATYRPLNNSNESE